MEPQFSRLKTVDNCSKIANKKVDENPIVAK